MLKWVIDFGLDIEQVKKRYGKAIPNLPYAKLCDWLVEQLINEFPRYVVVEQTENARDGETLGVRMIAASPFRPQVSSKYFELADVRRYEET